MKKLVIATGNAGKLQEIQHYFQEFAIDIIPQTQMNVGEIVETGQTFVENALIKARHAAEITGLPALADDSGLVINALQGAPGIYSARYAGEVRNDTANINKVLSHMHGIVENERQAHFYCVMVLMRSSSDPAPLISTGIWHGSILTTARGQGGHGYDPIFYVPSYQCSAAELNIEIKNKLSHRGLALNHLRHQIHEFI